VESIILIQTEVGRTGGVIRALAPMREILAAEVVTGPYDIVARARTASEDILVHELETAIRSIPGVTRTVACVLASQERVVDVSGDPALAKASS
jgi:DNA-binding Lrp family transcriptional regulator